MAVPAASCTSWGHAVFTIDAAPFRPLLARAAGPPGRPPAVLREHAWGGQEEPREEAGGGKRGARLALRPGPGPRGGVCTAHVTGRWPDAPQPPPTEHVRSRRMLISTSRGGRRVGETSEFLAGVACVAETRGGPRKPACEALRAPSAAPSVGRRHTAHSAHVPQAADPTAARPSVWHGRAPSTFVPTPPFPSAAGPTAPPRPFTLDSPYELRA